MATLKDLQDLTLKFVNSYSSDGEVLPVSDNADLLLLVNDYLNLAYRELAQIDRIVATKDYVLTDGSFMPDKVRYKYTLPTDFLDIDKIEYTPTDGYYEIKVFEIRGNTLIIPYDYPITLVYFKLPDKLTLTTDVPLIHSQYHDYLAYYSAGKWLHQNGKQADGIDYLTLYEDGKRFINPIKRTGVRTIKSVRGMW